MYSELFSFIPFSMFDFLVFKSFSLYELKNPCKIADVDDVRLTCNNDYLVIASLMNDFED